MKTSLPSTDCEYQALLITVPNDYKENVSPQRSLSDFSQNTTPFTEVKNSLHGSNASFNDVIYIQVASTIAPSIVQQDSKIARRNKFSAPDSSESLKRKYNILTDRAISTSNVVPPALKPLSELDLPRKDSLTSHLSTENFQFKPQLTPLYMVSTP